MANISLARTEIVAGRGAILSYEEAVDISKIVTSAKEKLRGVDEFFDPIIASAHKTRKVLCEAKKEAARPYNNDADFGNKLLSDYETARAEKMEAGVGEESGLAVVENIAGVSFRQTYEFKIVAAALLPRQFLIPDESAIRKFVNSLGDAARIPGVEITPVKKARISLTKKNDTPF